jgi:hydrogenase nickel incorporation protein HypA/HybF
METLEAGPDSYRGARVVEVRLRVGVLAAVVEDSLQFCYGMATEGTALEGSRLVVKLVPVVMHCARCEADVEIKGVQSFRCPRCDEPCGDLRQGRELEIEAIEIEEADAAEKAGSNGAGGEKAGVRA